MDQAVPSPGVQGLLNRIAELEFDKALSRDREAAKDARIADLEKNQKKPRKASA